MRYVKPLLEVRSVEVAGGKAANLSRAARSGYRVPGTLVLECSALSSFLSFNQLDVRVRSHCDEVLQLAAAEAERAHARLSEQVRAGVWPPQLEEELRDAQRVLGTDAGRALAVRSSAVCEDSGRASFAGVFESVLGVRDAQALLDAVQACWCALWSPRALRYAERLGLRVGHDAMGLLIQEVVAASCAGVAYTARPATGDPARLQIHAARGLAVDLLSGSGEGECLVLDWDDGHVVERESGHQKGVWRLSRAGVAREDLDPALSRAPVLSESQASEVADLARGLDRLWSERLDIEWAWTDAGVWLLQVRPLTALPDFFSLNPPPPRLHTWQRARFVIPLRSDHPAHLLTPLYADLSENELWFRHQPADIILTGVQCEELDVHGYRYACYGPMQTFFDFLGRDSAGSEAWLDANEVRYRARWDTRAHELAGIADACRSATAPGVSLREAIAALFAVRDRFWDLVSFAWSGPQSLGWMSEALLRRFTGELVPGFPVDELLGTASDSHSFCVTRALQQLGRALDEPEVRSAFERLPLPDVLTHLQRELPGSRFLAAFERLCWEHGKVPPSWRDRPPFWSGGMDAAQLLHAIKRAMLGQGRDVSAIQSEATQSAERSRQKFERAMLDRAPDRLERFRKILGWARYWTQALNDRHGLSAGQLHERELIWRVGARLREEDLIASEDEILLLRRSDLESLERHRATGRWHALLSERRRAYERSLRLRAPEQLGGGAAPAATDGEAQAQASTPATGNAGPPPHASHSWSGKGITGGQVIGRARPIDRIDDPGLLDSLAPGDIAVLPHAEAFFYADWHSLFTVLAGVVSPGRPSHHLVQVARECRVPVIGYLEGPLGIRAGDRIQIDGRSGSVVLLGTSSDESA
jgi:hypothetical protein